MTESLPEIIEKIGPLDERAMAEAKARQNTLTKPEGSLGRLRAAWAGLRSSPFNWPASRAGVYPG